MSDTPKDAPTLDQIIATLAEMQWSVEFDQLHDETLTTHGRWVLTHATDVLRQAASSLAALSTLQEAAREHFAARDSWSEANHRWQQLPVDSVTLIREEAARIRARIDRAESALRSLTDAARTEKET